MDSKVATSAKYVGQWSSLTDLLALLKRENKHNEYTCIVKKEGAYKYGKCKNDEE